MLNFPIPKFPRCEITEFCPYVNLYVSLLLLHIILWDNMSFILYQLKNYFYFQCWRYFWVTTLHQLLPVINGKILVSNYILLFSTLLNSLRQYNSGVAFWENFLLCTSVVSELEVSVSKIYETIMYFNSCNGCSEGLLCRILFIVAEVYLESVPR